MKRIIFRSLEAIIVASALAVLTVRSTQTDAFREYRRNGGRNGFWQWFAKDKCGVELPWTEDQDEIARAEREKEKAERTAKQAATALKRAKAAAAKMAEEEKKRKRAEEKVRKAMAAKKTGGSSSAKRHGRSFAGGSGGTINSSGKSSFRPAVPGQMYRVNGIRGIEFGSSDNAPPETAKPLLSIRYDENGEPQFESLKWRENRNLSDNIYGFSRAQLDHTYDSGQLERVTLHKSFPLTEEGMKQAMDFYSSMSGEASADLGFEVVDIDRTGNERSATICEFKNRDGETSIRGSVNVWNEKNVTVSLSVTDSGYTKLGSQQANDAYLRGDQGLESPRVEVWGRDFSAPKAIANELLAQ